MNDIVQKIKPYGSKANSFPIENKEDSTLNETTEIENIPNINAALELLKVSRQKKRKTKTSHK